METGPLSSTTDNLFREKIPWCEMAHDTCDGFQKGLCGKDWKIAIEKLIQIIIHRNSVVKVLILWFNS